MARGEYNGFSIEDQSRGGQLQTTGYNNGMLVRQWECVACLVHGNKPGDIIAHLEDYSEPFDGAIWLCYRCHTMLHARFDHHDAWIEYISNIRDGYQWPLAFSYHAVLDNHVRSRSLGSSVRRNEQRSHTILDRIESGELVPGPEAYQHMKLIHEKGIKYFKERDQASLF